MLDGSYDVPGYTFGIITGNVLVGKGNNYLRAIDYDLAGFLTRNLGKLSFIPFSKIDGMLVSDFHLAYRDEMPDDFFILALNSSGEKSETRFKVWPIPINEKNRFMPIDQAVKDVLLEAYGESDSQTQYYIKCFLNKHIISEPSKVDAVVGKAAQKKYGSLESGQII